MESRPFSFSQTCDRTEAALGNSKVVVQISCTLSVPYRERPHEGIVSFSTSFPFSSDDEDSSQGFLSRLIEHTFKKSHAIDTESLCVLAGVSVWSLRIDTHVLEEDGSIADCATRAIVLSLRSFRRPDVTVVGNSVTVHNMFERNPVPLGIHHSPVCVTLGCVRPSGPSTFFLVDPTKAEEESCDGLLHFCLNEQRECTPITKFGGSPLTQDQFIHALTIASTKAQSVLAFKEG